MKQPLLSLVPPFDCPDRLLLDALSKPHTLLLELDVERFSQQSGDLLSIGSDSANQKGNWTIYLNSQKQELALVLELLFDFNPDPLRLSCPTRYISKDSVVIVRYQTHKLDLHVDGVLIDEEWPLGTPQLKSPIKWNQSKGITSFKVWDEALPDTDVTRNLSDTAKSRKLQKQISGSQPSIPQYWRPAGHNTAVGDCMPFFHDGRFHLYYLFDRRHHGSKWGIGAHQWAHMSSTDLIRWEHHPIALLITESWEGSICTGSVFYNKGVYHAFYATRIEDRTEHLGRAISMDGIQFQKTSPNPFASPEKPYKAGPYRDPVVFKHDASNTFHMLVTAELEQPSMHDRGGCLSHFTSSNLTDWEPSEPFVIPGYADHQPECPDYFEWNGWYYLIFSHHGVAHYRFSKNPFGPWLSPAVDTFDSPQAIVMKTALFKGGRRLGVAFLKEERYAGCTVFRELVQHHDGTLGTKFPQEMIPNRGAPLKYSVRALTPGTSSNSGRQQISAPDGFGAVEVGDAPANFYLSIIVSPQPNTRILGVGLKGQEKMRNAHELWLDLRRKKAGWRTSELKSWEENERSSIYQIEGMDQPFKLEIIANDDILDVCIDDRRTLIARASISNGEKIFLFVQNGDVSFESMVVQPLE